MKKIVRFLAVLSVLMLINDVIQIVIAYRKRQRELAKRAARRLRLNRHKKMKQMRMKAHKGSR